jgi:radical SAM superfamily enzyme YgiQ (UPF0313 family)
MKILFINCDIRPDSRWKQFPVGLAYIVTAVRNAGFTFDILDVQIDSLTDQQVEDFLAKHKYDVIAFGTIVTHYKWVKWFINTIKAHQPQCKVIVGNSVGDTIAEVLFARTPVDIVVCGEGDVTIVEVLKALNEGRPLGEAIEPAIPVPHAHCDYPPTVRGKGVEGVIFRDPKGRIVNNGLRKAVRHIDEIPFPDWELFDAERYLATGRHNIIGVPTKYAEDEAIAMPVVTARGCVFKCTFCYYAEWNDPYRHRSPENVIAEIRHLKERYGANYINFWDNLSFHKLGPTEKFLDALIEADLGIHFTAAIRSDLFGRTDIPYEDRLRVAEKFRKAGALVLAYSLESANNDILATMNKRVKGEYFTEQTRLLQKVGGMVIQSSLVFGYPQETKETIAQTMQACRNLDLYPSPGFLLPLPATGMWKYAVDQGYIKDPDHYLSTLTERQDIVLNMTKLSDQELMEEVTRWLETLDEEFELGLRAKNALIRTGGLTRHGKYQRETIKRRNSNQFNYALMAGSL